MPSDTPNLRSAISDEAVAELLELVRGRIASLVREHDALERTIVAAREEERLWEQILAVRRGHPLRSETAASRKVGSASPPSIGHPAVQAVVGELEAAGRPLHISDLMRLLRDNNVTIPGSGTQANLIAHLRRDKRVIRPSRGMYGLAVWGLENMPVTRRSRRRKRRVRASARDQGRTDA
jgi:hypothetical protein